MTEIIRNISLKNAITFTTEGNAMACGLSGSNFETSKLLDDHTVVHGTLEESTIANGIFTLGSNDVICCGSASNDTMCCGSTSNDITKYPKYVFNACCWL